LTHSQLADETRIHVLKIFTMRKDLRCDVDTCVVAVALADAARGKLRCAALLQRESSGWADGSGQPGRSDRLRSSVAWLAGK
jgi:hypothetical protein